MSAPTAYSHSGNIRKARPVLWILLLFTVLAGAAPLGVTIPQLNGSLDAPYILESDPARDALSISASARIVRNQPAAPVANVTVRWRARLVLNGNTVSTVTHTTTHPVTGVYDAFVETDFELNPTFFLNDAATYSLELEVFHINDPATPLVFTPGDTATLNLLNFGHFSGAITFGTLTGTITSFSVPPPHYLGAGSWQAQVFNGTLSGGLAFANSANSTPLTATRSSANGNLSVTAGSAEIDDGDGTFTWNAWQGVRGPVLISTTGIAATNFRLTLPPGIGWRDGMSGVLRQQFRSESVALPLTVTLQPAVASVSGAMPVGREFIGAALPVAFTPPSWVFNGTTLTLNTPGTRFLRQGRYTQVAGQLPRANDSFFRHLQATAGSNLELTHHAAGAMTVALRTNAGDYTTHWPDADVGGLVSSLRVANDSVVPASSSLAANWVHLQYGRGCPEGGGPQSRGMRILAPTLTATPQGGITATGALATQVQFPGVDRHLEIGRNAQSQPVHETDEFTQPVRFYAPGFAVPSASSPAPFLLAEIQPEAAHALGFPGGAAYAAGLGLYAGFNFDYPAAMHVRSRVGGAAPFDYEVAARRAYARTSGVSGVIQAQPAALPFQAAIYGFPISFSDWAFNFLSNEMRDTFINGQVDLTGTPADFTQGMEDVRISCCGNLERFDIPQGENDKRLGYWDNFEISNSSARFVTPDPCDNSEAVLAYATTVEINGLPGRKAGQLGFLASGRLTVPADGMWDDAPSFLALEPQNGVAGKYHWWPRGAAFFNNPEQLPAGPGFITAAGDVTTPFFTVSTVRVHTTAVPEVDDEVLVGFLNGDYPASAEDAQHRGTPAGLTAAQYGSSQAHRPTATAAFFGQANAWNFPVIFNVPTGNFHSPEDGTVDLWVAEFPGRITRLNAEIAQVKFGVEIEGFTELTVGNLIEEAAAYGADGVAQVIGGQITGPIKDGLLSLAELLDNKLEKALGDAVNWAVNDRVDALITALRQMEQGKANWIEDDLNVELDAEIGFDQTGELANALRTLRNFQDGLNEASSGIGAINARLHKLENALDCIVLILSGDAGAHDRLGPLYHYAVDQLGLNPQIEISEQTRSEALSAVLADAGATLGIEGGWLADALDAIVRLRDIVVQIRSALGQGQEFLAEASAVIEDVASLSEIVGNVRVRIRDRLLLGDMQGRLFDFHNDELEAIIRGAIRDELFNSLMAVNLQSMLRARFGYLEGLIDDAINAALQAFTSAMIEALEKSGALDALDTAIQSFSGPLAAIKAARVRGEAMSTGDRLRELSLMAQVDFSIPTGTPINLPMSADAMIKYVERIADADTACGPAGEVLPEVILKASGGSAIGFGADSRASIAVKFGFDSAFNPRGFAGAFQIDSSEFNVSGMGMQDFTGMLALGQGDYYLSAHALGSFGAGGVSIDLEGGFFVGTTCDGEVFAFYPNFPLNGGGPYSGVVAHLSGKAPLGGAGCLLNITIGAEIGGFVMTDGLGGHLGGSISGEALCLLKAGGHIDLGYAYLGGVHQFDGEAGVEVKLGFKPFQISKSKTFHVQYVKPVGGSGDWQVNP